MKKPRPSIKKPSAKGAPKPDTQPRPQQPSSPTKPLRQRLWSGAKWGVGSAVALVGLVASMTAIWGPIWPTAPDIHPHDATDGASLILPFVVKDPSVIFDMPNVNFRCGVELVVAKDSKNQGVLLQGMAVASGVYSIPAGGKPINFPCNATDLLKVRDDGSLSFGGSSTQFENNRHVIYQPPWHILKMCIWVGGEYKILGKTVDFHSGIFQWPAHQGSNQWLEGPIAQPPPPEEQIPGFVPDALQCPPEVRYPVVLVDGPGLMKIVVDGKLIK